MSTTPQEQINALRKKQRKVEWITIGVAIFIAASLFLLVLFPTTVVEKFVGVVKNFENGGEVSRNASVSCMDPRNRNMAYCVERRAEVDANWRSMTRVNNGQSVNQFTLHGK